MKTRKYISQKWLPGGGLRTAGLPMPGTVIWLVLVAAVFARCSLFAAETRQFGISKIEDFIQKDENAPIYAGPGSFSFYAFVDGANSNSISLATVKLPNGQTLSLKPSSSLQRLDFLDYFDSPPLLEQVYPPGRYTLAFTASDEGAREVSLTVPPSFFPNAPRILNWNEAQAILADKPFQFRWEPFAEGTTNDLVQLIVYDFDDNVVFATPDQPGLDGALDGTSTSVTVPAGTLGHGMYFKAMLAFGRVNSRDITTYPGVPGLVTFVRQTAFEMATAGTADLADVRYQLSFTYFAYAGDFRSQTTVAPGYPISLDDCYVARLLVEKESFVPRAMDVTFNSPPGTAVANLEAAYRYESNGGIYFESPCLSPSTNAFPGLWTIGYNRYPIPLLVPDAQPVQRFVVPVPTVMREGDMLKSLHWSYRDAEGNQLAGAPSHITNQVIELFNRANFSVYVSSNLISTVTNVAFSGGLDWSEIGSMTIAYRDDLGNWYAISFDHSPPGDLGILDQRPPLGSLATPYQAQLVASNGVPPYRWIVQGNLPPGLSFDSDRGVISGIPTARGTFRFSARVEDQRGSFDQEQFFITITTNGLPVILDQPKGGHVDVGDFTWFEVSAEGTQPLYYQWMFEGRPLFGETNAMLTLINISANDAGSYSVMVTNVLGAVSSLTARLDVRSPPVILKQPASQAVQAGANVTFTVEVASAQPIFYQWRRNGEIVEGATNSFYTIANAQPYDAGSYDVLVAGPEGFGRSESAKLQFFVEMLTLTNRFSNRVPITAASGLGRGNNGGANLEPGEPIHGGIRGGSSVWMTWVAPADGIATFTTRGSAIDTVLAVYTGQDITQLQEIVSDDDGAEFYASFVRFNARAGQAYQIAIDGVYGGQGEILLNWSMDVSGARLPVITRQPVNAIVSEGATATFSIAANNPPPATAPLSYQWYFNGLSIANATNDTLTVPNVTIDNLGLYFVTVANETEMVFSTPVVIQINITDGGVDQQVSAEDKFANVARQTGNSPISLSRVLAKQLILRSGGSVARGYSGSQIFNTAGSTSEAGEPSHCGVVFGGASQWFSYVAEADGMLTIDTDGSDFDTVLAVYTGPGVDFDSLQAVTCDNDSGADGKDSRVVFPVTAGTIYYIAIDGVNGATGTARLNYRLSAPSKLYASVVNQAIRLRLVGPAGRTFTIESSTNLVDWVPVLSTNAPTGVIDNLEVRSGNSSRQYYRSLQSN